MESTIKDLHNKVGKEMIKVLVFAVVPLLILFIISFSSYCSLLFNELNDAIPNLPNVISSQNIPLSTSMGTYVKTAPLIAIIFFFYFHRLMLIKKGVAVSSLIFSLLMYYVFYAVIAYLTIFSDHDIANTRKWVRLFSENDFLLTFFYMLLYAVIYVLTVMLLWFSVGVVKELKKRG
ncbi:colicin immunity protein Cui [Enterobacter soli]|uniref:colicin immunity protein Cui n=1 Tax=Enterobacter soli TaxID=885040 RepID=UPI0034CF7423